MLHILDLVVFQAIELLLLSSPALLAGVITAIAARCHLLKRSSIVRNGILIGTATAMIRVPLVWIGADGLTYPDWRQSVGHILLIDNCIFEMTLVSKWRNTSLWPTILAGLVIVSSVVLGLLFAAIVKMMRTRARSGIISLEA